MRTQGVQYDVLGAGLPVTVFAHGLAGGVHETRPLAAGLPGTRVLLTFRGHGASDPLRTGWDFGDLAADLRAVADLTGATRAVGLSVGAGALLHLLAADPGRFEAIVLALPASLDRPRTDGGTERLLRLQHAVRSGDAARVKGVLLDELPADVRVTRVASVLAATRARELLHHAPPAPDAGAVPVRHVATLAAAQASALVLAQRDDPLHPVAVARDVAAALPGSRLVVLPPAGLSWTARAQVTAELRAHLAVRPPGSLAAAASQASAAAAR